MVADTLGQLPALNARLNEAVSRERQTGMQMVQSVLETHRGGEMKVGFFIEISAVVGNLRPQSNYRVY